MFINFNMSKLDNFIVELIIRSDDLIDKILNDLSFEKYNLLIDDLNNLSKDQKKNK